MPSTSSKANFFGAASVSQTMKVGEKSWRSQFGVLLLAGEDLVLVVERLALQLDPLFGAAEDVLEPLQGAQAELALAVELGDERDALGDLDQADRVAVVVGLAGCRRCRCAPPRRCRERGCPRRRRRAGRSGCARRSGRRPCAAAASPPAAARWPPSSSPRCCGVDVEEGVVGARVGDREDDQRAASRRTRRRRRRRSAAPTKIAAGDRRPTSAEAADQDPGQRLAHQQLEVEAAQVVGVVGRRRRRSARRRSRRPRSSGSAHARNLARGERMQMGLQREVVLQSGGEWVTVALELKPRTGVVRLLPPHHSGPNSFPALPPDSERTRRGGFSGSLRAQPRLQGSAHGSLAVPRLARRRSGSLQGLRPLRLGAHDRRVRAALRPLPLAAQPLRRATRASCAAASTAAPSTRSSTPPAASASPSR